MRCSLLICLIILSLLAHFHCLAVTPPGCAEHPDAAATKVREEAQTLIVQKLTVANQPHRNLESARIDRPKRSIAGLLARRHRAYARGLNAPGLYCRFWPYPVKVRYESKVVREAGVPAL